MKSIILAGGVGTRLWPLSREYYPKQFIQLNGRSLFQKTYERTLQLSKPDEIYVITNGIHQYLARGQIEELGHTIGDEHLLLEPEGKNTLPAITWAMQRIRSASGTATAAVFPSDHQLGDSALDQIRAAEPLAKKYLVTFGVRPTSPHTGYGYIRPGKPLPPGNAVDEFWEKPDEKTAREYVKKGYLWNSGIFLLSTGCFFGELKKYQRRIYDAFAKDIPVSYPDLESLSMDYGLLEHSKRVAVVTLETDWSDLGTFKALYDVEPHDSDGNVGKADFLSACRNFVHAPGKHVGLIGVNDLIVVDTADALLVCDAAHAEQVKQLVGRYKDRDTEVTRFHRKVYRPWGSYTILEETPFYKIKRVTVKPRQKLSLQLHHHRSEHWILVSGTAEVVLNDEVRLLNQGESSFVRSGTRHRLKNPGRIPLEVIEVQLGEYLKEDDIVRFEDDYGRE
jgi:mannose-1-phosphate guanylyltransferase / mannose-6-phosphate isomerase